MWKDDTPLLLALIAGLCGYAVTLLLSFNVAGCATVAVMFAGLIAAPAG